jgi:TatD DNase family protein
VNDVPTARWIDSHCHLQDHYRPEGTAVLETARETVEAGVGGFVCVGTDAQTSRQAVELVHAVRSAAETEEALAGFGAWATVGLHPHEASRGVDEVAGVLEEVSGAASDAGGPAVVAVGECGLDYHYDHSPRGAQRDAFAAQIALARQHDLTLVVHTREAWADTFDVLRADPPPARVVMHCFTGGPDEARRCLDMGMFLSFSGIVTFKGADDVRAAASLCPLPQLLVETDAPFLAPVPHRGKENRPAWVCAVGQAVSVLKGVAPDELARTSADATLRAFSVT